MDPELHERLTAIEKKLDDISKVVIGMRHSQRATRNRKLLYWAVVIVISFVSYISIKPYLEQLKEAYGFTEKIKTTNTNYGELLKELSQ